MEQFSQEPTSLLLTLHLALLRTHSCNWLVPYTGFPTSISQMSGLDNRESTLDRNGEGGRFSMMPLSGIYFLLSTSPLLCLDYAGHPSGNLCIIQAWGSRLREHRENQSPTLRNLRFPVKP